MGESAARVAGLPGAAERPKNAPDMVRYALVRMMLPTQKDAAKAARISERTARRMENHPWWPSAIQEARNNWYVDAEVVSRRAFFQQVDAGDGALGLRLLQRLDPQLRQATARPTANSVQVNAAPGSRVAAVFVVGPGALRRPGDVVPELEEENDDGGEE